MSTLDRAASPTASDIQMSYREAIAAAIEDEMAADPSVILMGEDVATEGGVFRTNAGLSERFGLERVRNTPICENGFLGVALGMAVTGMRPIVEIMFSDFLPTGGDVLVNELPKFRFMSGGQCSVPMTVRSIGGATGRFGTQHSATGESWFISLPGLMVATASSPAAAYSVLRASIRDDNPVLFFEHKALYNRRGTVSRSDDAIATVGKAEITHSGRDLTIVATLLMADRALLAVDELTREGIQAEVIDLRWLRPIDWETIQASVAKTGRLLVVEEQVHPGGWGATIISHLTMCGIRWTGLPQALSLDDELLVPYSPPLEDALIPNVERIVSAAKRILA